MSFIVAIDGPAGSGKGTIAKAIAEKYGFVNIDTGAMYRCVTLDCIRKGIGLNEQDKIIDISKNANIELKENGKVLLNGEDVSKEIRTSEVSALVSPVSSILKVRLNMVDKQRKLAEGKKVIMEGRDITTYVFPNADVKIYLDCDVNERAKRRQLEFKERGTELSFEEVLKAIKKRDKNDRNKEIGALMIADDAIIVDTTNYTIDEAVKHVSKIIDDVLGS